MLEMYVRKLAKCGVRLASITQELGDDPTQVMMRQIIALFDEYQSKENGKHVLRAMKENARQGYYNGSAAPLGYTTTVVETRGDRAKKKLVVDPTEAETVKLIFRLYLRADGRSGPLGLKATACWLNEHEYRTRRRARFGQGTIHTILTNRVYAGESVFDKRSAKTLLEKPASEHIVVEIPPIIAQDEFDAVAATLRTRDPKVSAPRTITVWPSHERKHHLRRDPVSEGLYPVGRRSDRRGRQRDPHCGRQGDARASHRRSGGRFGGCSQFRTEIGVPFRTKLRTCMSLKLLLRSAAI